MFIESLVLYPDFLSLPWNKEAKRLLLNDNLSNRREGGGRYVGELREPVSQGSKKPITPTTY